MIDTLAFDPVVEPPPVMPTVYGPPPPAMRAKDIPGLCSVKVRDLFTDIPAARFRGREDAPAIREQALKALSGVDMSMIEPTHTVNVVCSEHGFGMCGGYAYVEMLATIRDEIARRTGCEKVRLVVVAWLGAKEPEELIDHFGLADRFHGKVKGARPMDPGIPIETAMGTLYGLRKVYGADWIVHAHYDDPREVYLHRAIDRITKPFGMSYARMETRSIFHMMMGPRSGNFIGRAIADSAFVRGKLAFTATLLSSPDGIVSVDADNDLDAVGNRLTANILTSYGKMLALLRSVDECIVVLDGSKWPYYIHAGGMIFGHLFFNGADWFDLDREEPSQSVEKALSSAVSLGIRAVVVNHTLTGLSVLGLPVMYPVITARPEMTEAMRRDFANQEFMDYAEGADNLLEAMEIAYERGETDKVICFDGSYGAINCSPSMARQLVANAPACAREVDGELLPKWLKQRGIDPTGVRTT
jgi:hypothetical protein